VVLALGAIVTSWFAIRAFGKQTEEVTDQARMLKVQSDQLSVLRDQQADQRKINEEQTRVLALQAEELKASLSQRKDEAEAKRQAQASKVVCWFAPRPGGIVVEESGPVGWGAIIRNSSDLPVFDVRTFFHYIAEKWPGGDWEPVLRGGPVEKIRVIPPKDDRFVFIPEQVRNMMDQVDASIYVVSIEFTDAAGNRWERDPRGALVSRP
jgi:hypothetical protein